MAVKKSVLPNIRVQDSINEVLSDISDGKVESEDFWVEIDNQEVRYRASKSSKLYSDQQAYSAVVTPTAMELDLYRDNSAIGLVRFGNPRFMLPKNSGNISCGDVHGSRVLLGDDNGGVRVVELLDPNLDPSADPNQQTTFLDGHLSHTSVAKFFPSGQVALSAGMDYSIKLWDISSESMIQSLVHQKGLIDDIALLGRGRNLLSLCSKSSDIVLWEVGTPQVVHEYSVPGAKCLDVWSRDQAISSNAETGPLYNADGKVCIVGTDSATISFDIRSSISESSIVMEKPSDRLSIVDNTLVRSYGNEVAATDLRMPRDDLFVLSTGTQGDVSDVIATPSKIYINTHPTTYGYEISSGVSEVLCGENTGVLATYNDELWQLGRSMIRQFPL